MKPGYKYDPEIKQQSIEWQQSCSHRPKTFKCKNPLENFSPRVFGIKTASSSSYLPMGQTINAEYYSSLLVQLKDILKEKCHGSLGTCNPETGIPGLPVS
jgi:hypothetical protein